MEPKGVSVYFTGCHNPISNAENISIVLLLLFMHFKNHNNNLSHFKEWLGFLLTQRNDSIKSNHCLLLWPVYVLCSKLRTLAKIGVVHRVILSGVRRMGAEETQGSH